MMHERSSGEGHAAVQRQRDGDEELGRPVRVSEGSLRRQIKPGRLSPIEHSGPACAASRWRCARALIAVARCCASAGAAGRAQSASRCCASAPTRTICRCRTARRRLREQDRRGARARSRSTSSSTPTFRSAWVSCATRCDRRTPQTQQFKCDVIIGVPKGYELTATTQPYMRSTYALVFRLAPELESSQTADDLLKLPPEQLRALRIGVFGRSPGADWLLRNDLLDQRRDLRAAERRSAENPAHIIERDLAAGKIDVAIVWGPIAGFLVAQARRVSGVARRAVHARSRDQVRLRDLDGRALRREGMEGHAR